MLATILLISLRKRKSVNHFFPTRCADAVTAKLVVLFRRKSPDHVVSMPSCQSENFIEKEAYTASYNKPTSGVERDYFRDPVLVDQLMSLCKRFEFNCPFFCQSFIPSLFSLHYKSANIIPGNVSFLGNIDFIKQSFSLRNVVQRSDA